MTPKAEANRIANRFITKSVFDMDSEELKSQRIIAKNHAIICVTEIIDAIQTTIGHCTLKKLEQHEVSQDLDYWEKVKNEISSL